MPELVSVIVPMYNASSTVAETLESVLAQTHREWEAILIDDGSRDDTLEVVSRFRNPRIKILSQANAGVSAARNHALDIASGDFVAFLDSDDLWEKEKLEKSLRALRGGAAGLVYTDFKMFTRSPDLALPYRYTEPVDEADDYHRLLIYDYIPTLTVVARRDVLERAGRFDTSLHGTEDWDLWLRIARLAPIAHVPEPLSLYRYLRNSLSRNRDRHLGEERKVLEKHLQADDIPERVRRKAYWVLEKKLFINALAARRPFSAARSYARMLALLPGRTLDLRFLANHARIPAELKADAA